MGVIIRELCGPHKFVLVPALNKQSQVSAVCEYCGQVKGGTRKVKGKCPGNDPIKFYTDKRGHHCFVFYDGPHEEGNTGIVLCIYCALEPHSCRNKTNCSGHPQVSKFVKLAKYLYDLYKKSKAAQDAPAEIESS